MELYDLIFWLSFVLHNPKIFPDASFLLNTSCQKVPLFCCLYGHHPAPHARSSKSSLSNYLVLLMLSPFSVVHALTYKNTKIPGLGEIIHWDLVFFSILFTIILKFRHSVFKSCQKCGFHVVSFLPLFCCVLFIEEVLGGEKEGSHYYPSVTFLETILVRYNLHVP